MGTAFCGPLLDVALLTWHVPRGLNAGLDTQRSAALAGALGPQMSVRSSCMFCMHCWVDVDVLVRGWEAGNPGLLANPVTKKRVCRGMTYLEALRGFAVVQCCLESGVGAPVDLHLRATAVACTMEPLTVEVWS